MKTSGIIGFLYRSILKPFLFLFEPETIHNLFGSIGYFLGRFRFTRKLVYRSFYFAHPALRQTICGICFDNPVGLAAGFDKDLNLCQVVGDIGFGFEEVGSITMFPYEGNPGKRLVRLKQSQGLIVNYGLKNKGVGYAIDRLKSFSPNVPIFVSIAKTNCIKTCDIEEGIADMVGCYEQISQSGVGNAIVLNISCPNSFGGEDFAKPDLLRRVLLDINKLGVSKPIFVKLPIDKNPQELIELTQVVIEGGGEGVIVSNLIKNRENIIEKKDISDQPGGISGKPTIDRSGLLIGELYQHFGSRIVIVGVGGIFCAEDAYYKIKQGACLVQLITGMIFQGPQLIGEVNRGLVDLLQKDGYGNINEAVGANFRI